MGLTSRADGARAVKLAKPALQQGFGVLAISDLSGHLAGPFSFVVPSGGCMAITGPSGAGKSLLLRMIADLDPNHGQVKLGDLDRDGCSASEWRRNVTYVAAEAGWWADTVEAHFPAARRAAAKALAERLGLKPELFESLVTRLSTGEKQRLALIRALVNEPPALLLDEPTSSLDQESVARMEAVLKERLAAGLVLVMVTHDLNQADRLGDHRYDMRDGRLTAR